jgi:hypothetical protein
VVGSQYFLRELQIGGVVHDAIRVEAPGRLAEAATAGAFSIVTVREPVGVVGAITAMVQ